MSAVGGAKETALVYLADEAHRAPWVQDLSMPAHGSDGNSSRVAGVIVGEITSPLPVQVMHAR